MKKKAIHGQVQSVVICDSCRSIFLDIITRSREAAKKKYNDSKGANNHFEAQFWGGAKAALQTLNNYFSR